MSCASRALVLWLGILPLAACSSSGDVQRPPSPPAAGLDERLVFARTVARQESPTTTPHLDTLAAVGSATTPGLGLEDLLADSAGPTRFPILLAGDVLAIEVLRHEELGGTGRIDPQGLLEVPPLRLVAAGLTPDELRERIEGELSASRFVDQPAVTLRFIERVPRTAHVAGRVLRNVNIEGQPPRSDAVELPADRPLSLYALLGQVQGLWPDADAEQLLYVRQRDPFRTPPPADDGAPVDETSPPPGRVSGVLDARCYHFSYAELAAAHLAGRHVWVKPEDHLIVPRRPDVFIYGSVEAAGRYSWRPGLTLGGLLLEAGGPSADADRHTMLLLSGEDEREADPGEALAPWQVVFIPARLPVYIVGLGVIRNGPLVLPPTGLTAVQALKEAGWFTRDACRDEVAIWRNGRRIEVPLEVIEGERRDRGYELQPGDTVYVPESSW